MDYIDNDKVNLNITGSNVVKSLTFTDYINDPINVFTGFYISLGFTDVTITGKTVKESFDEALKTEWVGVKTTKTITGFELYLTNNNLPQDYSERGTVNEIGTSSSKYKLMFIGYKDNLTDNIVPVIVFDLLTESVIFDINTTIKFDLNPKCSYFLNEDETLSYMNILESKLDYDEEFGYSILTLKNKLDKDRELNDISSADYINGVLKY